MAVATYITGSTTIRNGTVVTTCLPTGNYKTDNDGDLGSSGTVDHSRDVEGPAASVIDARLSTRFDDPTYYSA